MYAKSLFPTSRLNPKAVLMTLMLGLLALNSVFAHNFSSQFISQLDATALEAAKAGLKGTGKGIFAMFYSERCIHCKNAFPELVKAAEAYKEDSDTITFVTVDALNDQKAQKDYSISYFPTVFLIVGPTTSSDDLIRFDMRVTPENVISFIKGYLPVSRDVNGNKVPVFEVKSGDVEFIDAISDALASGNFGALDEIYTNINNAIAKPDAAKNGVQTISFLSKIVKSLKGSKLNKSSDVAAILKAKLKHISSVGETEKKNKVKFDLIKWKNSTMLEYLFETIISKFENSKSSSGAAESKAVNDMLADMGSDV